jgi:hypothetical protein
VVKRLVEAAVEKVLAPWRRSTDAEKIVQRAVDQLPFRLRSWLSPTVWQLKAAEGARRAIRALPADAPRAEVEAAAAGAVANVIQEYEHQERSQRIVSSVVLHLSGETWEEREEAKDLGGHLKTGHTGSLQNRP